MLILVIFDKFDKIDGSIEIYGEVRYLVLFGYWWYDKIFDNIQYLINEKSGIIDIISHNFAGISIDSYNSLSIEKAFQNAIIPISSVVNKTINDYYYDIFLEKGSYKDKSNTQYF